MQLAVIENEDKLVNTVASLCEAADGILVKSPEGLGNATDLVKLIKTRHKEFDGERISLVKPLNDTVDKINGRFKLILAPLKSAEEAVKSKMLTYQQEESRKAEEARREAARVAAEAAKMAAQEAEESDRAPLPTATVVAVPEIPPAPRTAYGTFGGVSTVKKVWAYELTDMAALVAARPDLVMVDSVKVNAEIRGRGGDIPGLRIYQQETISVR